MDKPPPVALTIAGSDNSAGAGAQADLKTFTALGVYGVTAITCVVAEVPGRVTAIQPVEEHIVAEQIRLVFESYPVAAIKTGMLYSTPLIETVCSTLEEVFSKQQNPPALVVDPVMVATSGDSLLQCDAVQACRKRLFPLATLVTPNLDEVHTLLGGTVTTLDEMHAAGEKLVAEYGRAFLLKGGHLRGEVATDLLFESGRVCEFTAAFVPGVSTHGTGCTMSAAVTAGLAHGLELADAVAEAKQFVTRAIEHHFRWKCGATETDALNHFLHSR
jgi:hydroxymethylpyrimidine/phosphomethylpyrimidine kinase